MKSIHLKNGQMVLLREVVKDDAPELIAYLHKIGGETDFLTFGPGELSVNISDEEAFLEESRNVQNGLIILALVGNEVIGCLQFTGGARSRTRHAGEFGVSVLKNYWNQGIGTAMLYELLEWAKASTIIRKLNLRVRSDNISAVRLYNKFGFVQEGLISREFFISGTFYDSIHMGLNLD
ncbi:MAG: GNAT family protein [Peptococcaceae bacterium]|nr:GNAT family protein [Peptococcaceae bacterium]